MAKFCDIVGFVSTKETSPGVWEEVVTERKYYGDVDRNTFKYQSSGNLNDDINISNEISIVADAFANENFSAMRYLKFMGVKWKINSVEVRRPRLILNVGGVYNG
jgi:fructose-1,6-bisphosphatase/inositol monophosphatase family enzyme